MSSSRAKGLLVCLSHYSLLRDSPPNILSFCLFEVTAAFPLQFTERRGREDCTNASYSGGTRFRSRPEDRKLKGFQSFQNFLFPHANYRNSTLEWIKAASLQMLSKPWWRPIRSGTRFLLKTNYCRTPRHWDGKPSGYAENPNNWSFLWKQATLTSEFWLLPLTVCACV